MPAAAARAALRPVHVALRRRANPNLRLRLNNASSSRSASTTSEATEKAKEATEKAKETASNVTAKASQGLSKVQSSAGESLGKVSSAASSVASSATQQAGRVNSVVSTIVPNTVYYSKVAWEMSKIIFHTEKMYPPSGSQLQSYYQTAMNSVRNPSSLVAQNPGLLNPQQFLNRARNVSNKELWTAAIILAQVLGFFTVGEMIGKMKVVGYRGKVEHEHEH